MARQPVEGKSPKNTEKKEYQFWNVKKGVWQPCRWAWFIVKRKAGAKTRFKLPDEKRWTNMKQLFEDKRDDNKPAAGPGRLHKYGEPASQMLIPESWQAGLAKKLEKLEKKVAKNKIIETQK